MALRYPGPVGGYRLLSSGTRQQAPGAVLGVYFGRKTQGVPPVDQVPFQSQGSGLDISGTRHQLYPNRTPTPQVDHATPHVIKNPGQRRSGLHIGVPAVPANRPRVRYLVSILGKKCRRYPGPTGPSLLKTT
jgi:hypothetical protein